MTLLAAAGALVLLATANSAHMVDEMRQRDHVRRASGMYLSRAIAAPCLVTSEAIRLPAGERAVLDVRWTGALPSRTVEVESWWQGSGFGNSVWHRHTSIAGGWCE